MHVGCLSDFVGSYDLRGAFQQESVDDAVILADGNLQSAAPAVGGQILAGEPALLPDHGCHAAGTGAAGKGKILHTALKSQYPDFPIPQHLVIIYIRPLGESRIITKLTAMKIISPS